MFKIGINSVPRIVSPEVTETQESQQQNVQEQVSQPETKPVSAANTSIRSEAMFSATAMRAQLTQQLARNESLMDRGPLTSEQVSREINTPLDHIHSNRFTKAALEIENVPSINTLFTGDDKDYVKIVKGNDGLVHIEVNGKEAWSGTEKQFQLLTIDTGGGDDVVENYVSSATILTGDGDDSVTNLGDQTTIKTGNGYDGVYNFGNRNQIETGNENDSVKNTGNDNEIRTGSGDDSVFTSGIVYEGSWLGSYPKIVDGKLVDNGGGDRNIIDTGDGNDKVAIDFGADDNRVSTGSDFDKVSDWGNRNQVDTGEDN